MRSVPLLRCCTWYVAMKRKYLSVALVVLGLMGVTMFFVVPPQYYQGPVSDHFDGKRFYNPGKPAPTSFLDTLRWYATRKRQPWPEFSDLQTVDIPPRRVDGNQLRVSFVGHVTLLIQTQGLNILTDPVWSERVSPFSWIGPKRVHPPGIRLADLPPIDLVLISHNHYDHLDLATLEQLWQRHRMRIITPLGNDAIIHERLPDARIDARDWGQQVMVSPDLTVYLEPMHHWSARSLRDRNQALWATFVLATPGGKICFVGDSGYGGGDNFRHIAARHGALRLAVLPIGSYEPRWFMAYNHMNPAEALQAWVDLGRPPLLPVHYDGTFQLADNGYEMPLADLARELQTANIVNAPICSLKTGQHWWVEEDGARVTAATCRHDKPWQPDVPGNPVSVQ